MTALRKGLKQYGCIYKEPNSGPFDLQDGGEHWAKGWQTADEYLSGNVRQKLRTAQRVAARDPFFAGNVDALIAAQPKDLEASEIEVRLGATWLDKKYIRKLHLHFSSLLPFTCRF